MREKFQDPSLWVAGKLGEELAERVDHDIHETREEPGFGAELLRGESDPPPKDPSQNVALADVVWDVYDLNQLNQN